MNSASGVMGIAVASLATPLVLAKTGTDIYTAIYYTVGALLLSVVLVLISRYIY